MSARDAFVSFIRETITPTIALLSSFDAEAICEKNNLSFNELILPFSQPATEGKMLAHIIHARTRYPIVYMHEFIH